MSTPAVITDIKVEGNAEQLNAEQRILELCAQNPGRGILYYLYTLLFVYFTIFP